MSQRKRSPTWAQEWGDGFGCGGTGVQLELELLTAASFLLWVLGTEIESFLRTECSLNH